MRTQLGERRGVLPSTYRLAHPPKPRKTSCLQSSAVQIVYFSSTLLPLKRTATTADRVFARSFEADRSH